MKFPFFTTSGLAALFLASSVAQGPTPVILVGPAAGGGGLVRELNATDGSEILSGFPFGPDFAGGVRVAFGDVNGDGTPDPIVGSGPGGGTVRVVDGRALTLLHTVAPFGGGFTGGVYVAAGDVNADGRVDLIVGGGSGSGQVRVLSGTDLSPLADGFPFTPIYAGGVTVAAGDFNADGRADIIAGTAIGGAVRILSGVGAAELAGGFPYGPLFLGGVNVAAGDINGDGHLDVVTAPRTIGGQVLAFSSADISVLASLTPYPGIGGVNVAVGDVNGDGRADIITGPGSGTPRVRIYSGLDRSELHNFLAYDPAFTGGVFVAAPGGGTGTPGFTSATSTSFRTAIANTFTVTSTGGPGTTITHSGVLPPGVTFVNHGNGTATLAGNPPSGSGGTYALIFTALRGGVPFATQSFTLSVRQAPAITSSAMVEFRRGQAGSFTITSTGFPTPTLEHSGGLPDGITWSSGVNGTALLTGTATVNGTYPTTVTARNSAGESTTQTLIIILQDPPAPGPPGGGPPAEVAAAFTSAASATWTLNASNLFVVTTSAVPEVATIEMTGVLPNGVTFGNSGHGTATLTGVPSPGSAGTYPLVFSAFNGVGAPAEQHFTLTITNSGTPIFTSPFGTTFTVGASGSFTITTSASPTATTITHSGALPAGVTFINNGNGTATLSGIPDPGTDGSYPLEFTASNGVGTGTQGFVLTVNAVSGGAPTITSASSATFVVDGASTFTVTTTGTPAPTISRSGTLPSGITFTDNGNGTATLAGMAAPGTAGSHALSFTAINSNGTATQDFTLTINNVSTVPVFTSATFTTVRIGVASSFAITTAAEPPVTDITLTGTLPAGVTFTDNVNGTATLGGMATAGPGLHALIFTASNGVGSPVTQNFTLSVQQVADITSLDTTTFVVDTAGTFTVTTIGTPIPSLGVSGTLPPGTTFTDNGDGTGTLGGTPEVGTAGDWPFTITAINGVGAPDTQAFTLVVSGNNPPSFAPIADPAAILEDAALQTVMVTGITAGTGETQDLQVTATSNNTALIPNPTVTYTSPNPTGSLSYTPVANMSGTAVITVTLTDAGEDLDLLTPGDNGTFSRTFTVTVDPVNDAPTIAGIADPAAINEDAPMQTVTFSGVTAGINEAQALTVTAVSGNTALIPHPAVTYNSPDPGGSLTYTPVANANGSTTVTVTVRDAGLDGVPLNGDDLSVSLIFTVMVNAVNDAPTFVKGADQTKPEDSPPQMVPFWATSISSGPLDEAGQALVFSITGNTNPALFSVAPTVSSSGDLAYALAPDTVGSSTITLTLTDNGGTANGGVNSSSQTFVIGTTDVNDAPSFTKGANQTVAEDAGLQTLTGWATAISAGPPNESSQTLAFEITVSSNAALFSAGPAVSPAGDLTYTPAPNANGSATITLRITDNGGTADGGVNVSPTQQFDINVTAVNDPPSFTGGGTVTRPEDSGLNTVSGWATAINPGAFNEGSQTLTFVVTNNTNTALFVNPAGLPAVDATTGNLTFTPAANVFGTATITLRLDDNGGGLNQSATVDFDITITNVNDAPSFTKGADETVLEDALPVTVTGWATAIDPGPNESDALTFNVSNNNNTLFSSQPAVAANGTLTYTLALNQNGSATVSVSLTDDGMTPGVPGDDLTTAVQTFTITVTAVNDAPVAVADSYGVLEGATLSPTALTGVLANDTDVENNTLTATLVGPPPTNGTFTLNANGSFTYLHDGSESPSSVSFTYLANDGTDDSTLVATVTITITPVNDAPVADDETYGVNEGGTINELAPGVLTGDTDAELTALTAVHVSGSGPAHAASFTLNPNGSFTYTHNGSETLTDSFQYQAFDGAALSNVATVTINITPVNDGPVIDLDADDDKGTTGVDFAVAFDEGDLPTLIEDADAVGGAVIADNDHTTLTTLTVTLTNLLDPGDEVLAVDLAGDTDFTADYDTTTDTTKGVLTITAVTPQPIADFVTLLRTITYSNDDLGPDPTDRIITFVANDGVADGPAATTTITVTTFNNAPTAVDDPSYTVDEGGTLNIVAPGVLGNDTDPDGDTLHAVLVSGPAHALSFTLHDDGSFDYVHDGDGFDTVTFTYRAFDGLENSATFATVTITVNSVNDPPSFTGGGPVTVLEDSGPYSAGWATAIDKGGPEESLQTLTFVVVSNTNTALFAGGGLPAVDATTGNLTFTPAANAAGTATITLRLDDNGGGTNQSATQQLLITVTGVNDAPAGTNNSVAAFEDTLYTFTAADFGFTDPNDTPANALASVLIATLPAAGSLTLSGSGFAAGTEVSAADITAGNLKFLAAANASGTPYTNFTFQVRDNGGTADSGVDLDPSANTLTINVTAVNDAPAGTSNTVTTPEDVQYTLTAADFGFTDPNDSPANALAAVVITTLPGAGSLTLSGGAVSATQEISVANITAGNLKFLAAANASGTPYTNFTFQVRDNGGTANSGVDLDPSADTLTINVTPTNDAPAGTNNTVSTNEDVPYEFTTTDFGFTDPLDSPANNFLSVRIATLPSLGSLTLSGGAVSIGQFIAVADITAGNLDFTPVSNGSGTPYTSFTFQVRDDGGTLNGGVDLDQSANTLSINVLNINDAPSGVNGTVGALEDTLYTFTAGDFAFTDANDSPANGLLSVVIATLPAAGSLTLSGGGFAAGTEVSAADVTAGNLKFLAAANAIGAPYTTFTFQVRDNGGTTNGGVDLDGSANTVTINVSNVNDAPSGTHNTVATPEDIQYTFTAADFGFTDPNDSPANALQSVVIATLPGAGSLTLSGGAVSALQDISLANINGGNLRFLGALNAFGAPYTTFTFQVRDNGGTLNGGVNLDPTPNTLTINVTPVNDAPTVSAEGFDLLGNTQLRVDMTTGASTPFTSESTAGVSSVKGVLDNDSDIENDPFTVTAITGCVDPDGLPPYNCTFASGAVLHLEASGEFSYTPAPGATSGNFTYTVTDTPSVGVAATAQGTVTFTYFDMIWYVDADAAAGNGTSSAPFNSLASLGPADTDDYIFVHNSAATLSGGVTLEANQHLIGEFSGLSIPRNLNGNGTPTNLVAASGTRPLITNGSGNAITITTAMPIEIIGLALSGSDNAIDLTTAAALTGSSTITIGSNEFRAATNGGIDVNLNASTTGTLALNITSNTWNTGSTHNGNAIDVLRSAGTLNLNISNNTNVRSNTANAIVVNGGAVASTNITGFSNNTVHQDTAGAGVVISNATFDSDLVTGGFQQVDGNNLAIGLDGGGSNGVGAAGMSLSTVQGSLFFDDLDVYGASGLGVLGTGAATNLSLSVTPVGSGGTSEIKGVGDIALSVNTATIDLRLSEFSSTTTANGGLALTNVAGQFSAPSSSTITKTAGAGTLFSIDNSTAGTTVLTAAYAGTINNSVAGARSISIGTADSGSSVSFSGQVTDSPGQGVSLTSNTGATIAFSGGLTLSTGNNNAFSATGGGTLTVTDPVGSVDNNITSAAGTALTVSGGTTIGASGLTFESISAGTSGSPASGIVLSSTGSSGGLTVTGDGSGAMNGSGGTIQNTSGVGISITSARNISLTQLNVASTGSHGLNLSSVTNFTFQDASVISAGDGNDEQGFNLLNLFGATNLIEDVRLDDITEDGIQVRQDATDDGTMDVLTIRRLSVEDHVAGFGESGIEAQPNLASNFKLIVDDSDFTLNTNAVIAAAGSTSATHTGTFVMTIQNSTFNAGGSFGSGGPQFLGGGSGTVYYTVDGNQILGTKFSGLILNNDGTQTTHARVVNNTITGSGATNNGNGISMRQDENGTMFALIDNNNISLVKASGISLNGQDATTDDAPLEFQAIITNNTVTVNGGAGAFGAGIIVESGTGVEPGLHNDLCVSVTGNNVSGTDTSPFFDTDIVLNILDTNATMRVVQSAAQVSSLNNGANFTHFSNPPAAIVFSGAACTAPLTPP